MRKYLLFTLLLLLLNIIWQCSPKTVAKLDSPVLVPDTLKKESVEITPPEELDYEALALDGRKLYRPVDSSASHQKKDSLLAISSQNFVENPTDLENIIWLGRRTAYLWRYREAIDIYTEGIQHHPESPELYRHRGHRYISIRELEKAIADFQRAAALSKDRNVQLEKDGIPNKLNMPLSNLQFNIYYHWGLAHYLKGEFERAKDLYEKCMDYSINSDLLVATSDWLYMSYRRMGAADTADWAALRFVNEGMTIIENQSYYDRCLLYKGLKKPEDLLQPQTTDLESQLNLVTYGYGVGNWYLYNGNEEKAKEIFHNILATDYWSAFGYIAAEADLVRLSGK